MNLLFLSNWERTDTWIAAAVALERRGHRCFLCVTRKHYVAKAVKAGLARDRILWLTRQDAQRAELTTAMEAMAACEARTGERVKDMILMDRFLRSAPRDWALRYATYVFARLDRFIVENAIGLAVGQPDNVPDLMAGMILADRGGAYAAPFEFRMPTHRFMLWDSKIEARPHLTGAATLDDVLPEDIAEARAVRDRVIAGHKMRQVAAKADAGGATRLARTAWRAVRGLIYRPLIVVRHDVYMYSWRSLTRDLGYHRIPLNRWRLRQQWRTLFEQPVAGERYVFYALNYAPEHTIDVEAPHFVSTLETVRNIARSLPLGVRLYVKEHPVGIGIRSPAELQAIKDLPGVRLIDPHHDSHALIKGAALAVSLSGTVSLEAALYGKQTAILSDIFIANFSTCRRLRAPWEVGEALVAPPLPHDAEADLRYLAWLISNSHVGTVIEPLVDPSSLSEDNVGRIADALEKTVAVLSR